MEGQTIGLLGGGQLGQMLCEAANPLGIPVIILDAANSPAKQVNAKLEHIDGSFTDPDKIRELARRVDILTVEIEHVDTHVLEEIAERGVTVVENGQEKLKRVQVQPSWRTLRVIQDKYAQKVHLQQYGVAVAESRVLASEDEVAQVGEELGYPFMLKARKDAYDGRGNYPVMKAGDVAKGLQALKGRALYAEKWASFKMELAVMVVKTKDELSEDVDATIAFPAVETIHEDSICKLVYAPARGISHALRREAQTLARKAVSCLWGKGVFGVEMFLMDDDSLLINEIAPRPHNSGHYTIEACPTFSQYKAQLLSILSLMPRIHNGEITSAFPATIMLNILGGATDTAHQDVIKQSMTLPNASLHMYGKMSKPARKIGHVTIVDENMAAAELALAPLLHATNSMRRARLGLPDIPSSSLPIHTSTPSTPGTKPLIAVTMGSDSDLHVLTPGLALLNKLSIPYHLTITSAHRTPAQMTAFARTASSQGYRVLIAAAGGAAHLPGMLAASTALPVIGVPVRGSSLDGMDSLLSIAQMPRGVPVACVSVNGGLNACLLAARVLGATDPTVRAEVEAYMRESELEVVAKARRLEALGWQAYQEGGLEKPVVRASII